MLLPLQDLADKSFVPLTCFPFLHFIYLVWFWKWSFSILPCLFWISRILGRFQISRALSNLVDISRAPSWLLTITLYLTTHTYTRKWDMFTNQFVFFFQPYSHLGSWRCDLWLDFEGILYNAALHLLLFCASVCLETCSQIAAATSGPVCDMH